MVFRLHVHADKVHQILLVEWAPDRRRVMMERVEQELRELVRPSRAVAGLSPDHSAERSPTRKATSVSHLGDDKVEQLLVLAVLDNMASPR